jgi:hypothetical protein
MKQGYFFSSTDEAAPKALYTLFAEGLHKVSVESVTVEEPTVGVVTFKVNLRALGGPQAGSVLTASHDTMNSSQTFADIGRRNLWALARAAGIVSPNVTPAMLVGKTVIVKNIQVPNKNGRINEKTNQPWGPQNQVRDYMTATPESPDFVSTAIATTQGQKPTFLPGGMSVASAPPAAQNTFVPTHAPYVEQRPAPATPQFAPQAPAQVQQQFAPPPQYAPPQQPQPPAQAAMPWQN